MAFPFPEEGCLLVRYSLWIFRLLSSGKRKERTQTRPLKIPGPSQEGSECHMIWRDHPESRCCLNNIHVSLNPNPICASSPSDLGPWARFTLKERTCLSARLWDLLFSTSAAISWWILLKNDSGWLSQDMLRAKGYALDDFLQLIHRLLLVARLTFEEYHPHE